MFDEIEFGFLRRLKSVPLATQLHSEIRRVWSQSSGSLGVGFRIGLFCIGCCWALLALLFVGGVVNIVWIAGLTIFVLLEKVIPTGRLISRLSGIGFTPRAGSEIDDGQQYGDGVGAGFARTLLCRPSGRPRKVA